MGELCLCRGAHKVYCFGCMSVCVCVGVDVCSDGRSTQIFYLRIVIPQCNSISSHEISSTLITLKYC